jgi:hypothetical protein
MFFGLVGRIVNPSEQFSYSLIFGRREQQKTPAMFREEAMTFNSFECAIHRLCPPLPHCSCRLLGHGVEADRGYLLRQSLRLRIGSARDPRSRLAIERLPFDEVFHQFRASRTQPRFTQGVQRK